MSSRLARALLAFAVLLSGCGLREILLEVHVPEAEDCGGGCPLDDVRSIETTLFSVDGTVFAYDCQEVREPICDYEDFERFAFLQRTEAGSGVEVRIHGHTEPECGGLRRFTCESFGDATIDLTTASTIPIWCDCPFPR